MPSRPSPTLRIALAALSSLAGHACAPQAPAPPSPSDPEPPSPAGETVRTLDPAVFVVFQAKDGAYWFGSDRHGVSRFDGRSILRFTTRHGLRGDRVRAIQQDRSGAIYVGSDGGVSRFDGRSFHPLPVTDHPGGWALQPEDLWFAGWQDEGVVYRWDGALLHRLAFPSTAPGDQHLAKYPRAQFPRMTFSPYDVYTIFKDSSGNLWFGTCCLGVCRYDGTSFAWAPKSELGFPPDDSFGVRSIAEDTDGKLWFSNTILRFEVQSDPPASPGTQALRLTPEPGPGKAPDPFAFFMSSVKDQHGDLWMALYRAGVWRYDGTRLTHYPVKDGEADVTVFSISKDNHDTLWLGTHRHGAFRFNGTTFEKFEP